MSFSEPSLTRRARLKNAAIPAPGPIRTLAKMSLTSAIGNGLFATIEAIFFTRSVGLTNHQVALGLGIAAVLGLLVNIPAGHLADKRDPRGLVVLFIIGQSASMVAFALIHSFAGFLVVAIVSSMFSSAGHSAGMALMARIGEGEERVRIRAFQRSVSNLGMAIGMAIAATALAMDTRAGYVAMVIGNAITYLASATIVLQFPKMPPISLVGTAHSGSRLVALRDRHFLIASGLNGIAAIQSSIQNIGVPLWIVQYTHAPRWWVAVSFLVNTISVVLLQVRFARGTGDLEFAARAFRRSGLFIGAACLLYASSQGVNMVLACVLLVAGAVVDVIRELMASAAGWAIGFGMAVEGLQGQYQGVYSMGFGLANIFGPILVTSTALTMGRPGWVILALLFIASGAAYPPLIRSHLKLKASVPVLD